jgi:hypothetical protein
VDVEQVAVVGRVPHDVALAGDGVAAGVADDHRAAEVEGVSVGWVDGVDESDHG